LSEREKIGSATIERWFKGYLKLKLKEREGASCPRVLGLDEHFFSRKEGYATTFCDLGNNKIWDVVLGRSEASLEGYLNRLKGKDNVEMVCIDLSTTYRSLVKKHFPSARIVADRFHVVKLVNHHFLNCWKRIDPTGSKSRGLVSLMRRHPKNLKEGQGERLSAYLRDFPVLGEIYEFKQRLMRLLLVKSQT
jgi:transposase